MAKPAQSLCMSKTIMIVLVIALMIMLHFILTQVVDKWNNSTIVEV